jgi:hypothetical protein
MSRLWSLVALGLMAGLTGCSAKSFMDRVAPETVQVAKTQVDYLRHGQFDQIEPSLDASIDRKALKANLAKMAAFVPTQDPVSVKTVGAYAECDSRKGCNTRVTLEYEFPSKWLMVQMIVHRQGGKSAITAFSVAPEAESLEAANRFTLRGRTSQEYLILGAAIISFCVMLYSLVLCIRTPMQRRKWLWIILILLGVGKCGVNWTSGQTFDHIFWVSVLPFGIGAELYGAWILYVSLPLGALLFLIFRGRLRKAETPTTSMNEGHPGTDPALSGEKDSQVL